MGHDKDDRLGVLAADAGEPGVARFLLSKYLRRITPKARTIRTIVPNPMKPPTGCNSASMGEDASIAMIIEISLFP